MNDLYCLYIIGPADGGPYKIGYSLADNIGFRLSNLQVGCWKRLVVHKTYLVFGRKNIRLLEREAHSTLETIGRYIRGSGEWFNISLGEARAACDRIVKTYQNTHKY